MFAKAKLKRLVHLSVFVTLWLEKSKFMPHAKMSGLNYGNYLAFASLYNTI